MWALFGTGSKYEIKKTNGISHFLEHLFFKGTKSRPKPGQVWEELDRIGAQKNAFTSKEYTGYYVKAAAKHFDIGLDVVSDILLEPLFKKEEIEKERGVILQEIAMYEDNPQRQAYDLFEDLMYGDQPAGWDTAGTPETVNNIKRDDILKYKNSHYHASNAVVAVAGNIDPEVAFSKVERAFKNMSDGRKITKLKVRERQKNPRVKFKKKDLDQTHLRLGARSYEMYDERRYALQVLATILGGNCSSYLWREIREKRGLAYYVGASAEEYTDSGYLLATAGVAHENLPKAVKKIVEIMRHLRTKGVSDKEINFAKEYIRGSMALAFETTDEVATFLSSQELFYKKIMAPEDILRKIEAVKRSDIIKVAKDIFRPEKINLAAIGPHEEGQVYEKILAQI
ncbi:MAG: Peptidase M16 domain protein [Candidatus Giovannonibacteria bacterium GW2011_GWA1_43_15]|uniref:Peptidase M16 domain protein n=1 Tax=Candidatus Giovannonibacteria bacterium GW2011_GWA2_44_26 TaxID=1618648 RepID=A0A0G1LVA3_9BACT|nr:MAG: Peptidase M16 domain protein [Candidatus Giovannonibacteria bacterium GW2011_GWB1_43_13]KKS99913.1 MAG: Peptidase M16 domain protein [Candidatus Giovannonibacteria bacterium GW2011_GWA1_43_15]KKT63614.1 MAG: Peptidase M16 domain protein [Candidatus Giovannonibacteria bacterium GW2011_GWA2_44_26]